MGGLRRAGGLFRKQRRRGRCGEKRKAGVSWILLWMVGCRGSSGEVQTLDVQTILSLEKRRSLRK